MGRIIKLNVDIDKIDFSKIDDRTDRQIRMVALENNITYIVAANQVLLNRTLLQYGGAS